MSDFRSYLKEQMENDKTAIVLHLGCGMDSRVERVGTNGHLWYDVDFPDVIQERKRYYTETEEYHMISSDVRQSEWLSEVPQDKNAIVIMEGISMYLLPEELTVVLENLTKYFPEVHILMDCYTIFAAKTSKYKNPINDVGVTQVYGMDDPLALENGTGLTFVKEHEMTPASLIDELKGMEKSIFEKVFAGGVAKKMYRLYEYEK